MYPTHTTSTTGTFRIPELPATPATPAPAARPMGTTAFTSGPVAPPPPAPAPVAAPRAAEPVRGTVPGPAPAAWAQAPADRAHAPAPVEASRAPAPAWAAAPEPGVRARTAEPVGPEPAVRAPHPAAPAPERVARPAGATRFASGFAAVSRAAAPAPVAVSRAAEPAPAWAAAPTPAARAAHPVEPEPVARAAGGTPFAPAPRAAEPAPAEVPRTPHPADPVHAHPADAVMAQAVRPDQPAPARAGHPAPARFALPEPAPEPPAHPADAVMAQAVRPDPAPVPAAHPADAAPARFALPDPAPARAPHPADAGPVPAHPADAAPARFALPEPAPARAPRPFGSEPPARGDVPAARTQAEPGIPHPTPEPPQGPPQAPPQGSGVPGPGAAEIAARAVARGMHPEDADTRGLPHSGPPARGTAVTEVPVHLPFRPQPRPQPPLRPRPEPPARPARKAPAGRRVPRGDDRLREHRGPVLPGWIAVAVGALALLGCAAVLWRAGVVPATVVAAFGAPPRAYQGLRATHWPPLAFLGIVTLLALGGLGRAKAGHAWVLTLFGRYRGTVRRTGLTWISPLLLRQRVDVRLRHWRSEPMSAVDSGGLALQVVVQVVWQVKDTARATLAVEDHTDYLAEQVESAMARVLSQLPADAFHEDAPTLRDAEAVGDALTRMLAAETEAVGIEVFSAQPTRIEYAPEVAEAMRRRRVAAIDAKHRDTVLTSVVDAVDDTVHRLTSRGIVELDDYERKALVKDLTVAFYTGRSDQ
ncbi:SPFH domain-containing protein [Streptomyces sp. NBC_00091]|uniref:SPFH domain-containing protein n=1 Tax=Streptomyces sp. NBC_00091 TaxID=2975648 RepID=UPI00224D3206|nr:SPFH domain-containing protein [Streptomyces sp. NBC_00091]MCX5378204.1 SPFH domain-containing protein [Streptomyces sp. NBC_00091]